MILFRPEQKRFAKSFYKADDLPAFMRTIIAALK